MKNKKARRERAAKRWVQHIKDMKDLRDDDSRWMDSTAGRLVVCKGMALSACMINKKIRLAEASLEGTLKGK